MAIDVSITDKDRLDWLEAQTRKSPTGISFNYVRAEDGELSGFRFMRRWYVHSPRKNIRDTIDLAIDNTFPPMSFSKETVKMPVLCIDCKYSKFSSSIEQLGYNCGHPSNISPVDGQIRFKPCDEMRGLGACGPEGRLFTAEEPSVPPMPASSPPGV